MEQSLQMISRQERLAVWSERIMACRSSGMSVRSWCQENRISEKTYFYWQKKLFETLAQQQNTAAPAFAEVTPLQPARTGNVAITVRMSGIEADIHSGADAATVKAVLRILKSC